MPYGHTHKPKNKSLTVCVLLITRIATCHLSPYTINLMDELTLKGVIQYYIEETEGPLSQYTILKVGKGRGEMGEGERGREERKRGEGRGGVHGGEREGRREKLDI